MKSRISAVVAFAAVCGISAFAWTGCSEEEKNTTPSPTYGCELTDPLNPPVNCGPADEGATVCSSTENVASCPNNECMAPVEQTGTTKNLRMGRIRLWAPDSLAALAAIAVHPNVAPKCYNNGTESFTWLIQVDETTKQIKTGGARGSTDGGKTFGFLNESVDASKMNEICPGFLSDDEIGAGTPVDLRPVTTSYTVNNGAITTPQIPLINVPIFDTSGLPIILPLRSASIKDMTITGSCVGKFEKEFWCDESVTGGWRTGGAIVAKITAEDADRIPVKSAGCQSLCTILVSDSKKSDGKRCKREGGKIPEIGTHCSRDGENCKDSFLLSATFGAYGVNITTIEAPPMDAGADTSGDDTGTGDSATGDSATGDTGADDSASDAADGS